MFLFLKSNFIVVNKILKNIFVCNLYLSFFKKNISLLNNVYFLLYTVFYFKIKFLKKLLT